MTDKSDRQARLLAETIHEGWPEAPGAAFAREAAALARRRRRLRQSLVAAGTMAGIAALFAVLLVRPAQVRPLPKPRMAPAYEIISDDELLAQLRDRPLLAVRKENGAHEFVFLDRSLGSP